MEESNASVKKQIHPGIYTLLGMGIVIILMGVFYFYTQTTQTGSIISIDVNPSIEISTNKGDKVTSIEGMNSNGKTIVDSMDLQGTDISVATNAIVGSLFQQGYLSQDKKDVLVSVMNEDKNKADALKETVSNGIVGAFSSQKVPANVMNQSVEKSGKAEELSTQYGISLGKAVFIEKVMEKDNTLKAADLAPMSIVELNNLISSKNIDLSKTVSVHRDEALVAELSAAAAAQAAAEKAAQEAQAQAAAAQAQAAAAQAAKAAAEKAAADKVAAATDKITQNQGTQNNQVPNQNTPGLYRTTACARCSSSCTCWECRDDYEGCDWDGCDDCSRNCKNFRIDYD